MDIYDGLQVLYVVVVVVEIGTAGGMVEVANVDGI